MVKYQGKGVYGAIAIGKALKWKREDVQVKREKIEDVAQELERLRNAINKAMEQLENIYEKALEEVGDKISANDKTQVQADMEAVKAILDRTANQEMSDSDVDELKAAKEKLMSSAQALFTKMYESMQGAQGAGPDMSGAQGAGYAGGAANDDIIDGDYREV